MVKRILTCVGIFLAFITLLLLVTPVIFKARINSKIKDEINSQFNAKVDYSRFNLSLISTFPNFDLSFDNVFIVRMDNLKEDTLASIEKLNLLVDIGSVIKGNTYKLKAITIERPIVNLEIDTNGNENWNIIKAGLGASGIETKAAPFSIDLDNIRIKNADLNYSDKRNNSNVQVHNVSSEITGSITDSNYDVHIKTRPAEYTRQSVDRIWALAYFSTHIKILKSDWQQKNYEAMEVSGDATIINLKYNSGDDASKTIYVTGSHVFFTQKVISLDSLNIVYGKSSATVKGELTNFISYLNHAGDLSGRLDIYSPYIVLKEPVEKSNSPTPKKQSESVVKSDSTRINYYRVPPHISLAINCRFDKVNYDKFVVESLIGQCVVNDEAISLNHMNGDLLGGSSDLIAKYDTKNTDHPDIEFNYGIKNMDLQKVYNSVKAVGEVAPGVKYVNGNFSGGFHGSGKLKTDMSIDYHSLTGEGKMEVPDAKVAQLPVLNEISKVAKIPSLQNLELKNAELNFTFNKGRINIQPTDLNFTNGYSLYMKGSSGFDQTVDYDMKLSVPPKEVISSSPLAQNLLSLIPGLSDNLPKTVGFDFKITGKANNPNVKFLKFE